MSLSYKRLKSHSLLAIPVLYYPFTIINQNNSSNYKQMIQKELTIGRDLEDLHYTSLEYLF